MVTPNPLVIPPGYGQAQLVFLLGGNPRQALSTFGFSTSLTNAVTVANDISVAWAAGWPAASGEAPWQFLGTNVRLNVGGVLTDAMDRTGVTYLGVSGTVPSNSAFLVRKNSSVAGRQNAGRFYFPPLFSPEADIDDNGLIGSADITAFNAHLATFFSTLDAYPIVPHILHHEFIRDPSLPAPAMIANPEANSPTLVTSLVLENQLATQRRRMRS